VGVPSFFCLVGLGGFGGFARFLGWDAGFLERVARFSMGFARLPEIRPILKAEFLDEQGTNSTIMTTSPFFHCA
jgi:hypothetical protein